MSPELLNQWLVAFIALFVAFHTVVLAVAGIAKLLSVKWPGAQSVVDACMKLSTDIGWVLGLLRGVKPPPSGSFLLLLGLSLPLLSGCAGTFEEARTVSHAARFIGTAVATPSERCQSLSDRQANWGSVEVVSASLAAPTGLSAIPVSDRSARTGLIGSSVGLAAFAVGAHFLSDSAGTSYVAEGCAQ